MPGRRGTLAERLAAKVDTSGGPDACHPFRGAKSKKRSGSRRGHLRIGGRKSGFVLAHVAALALATDGEFVKYDPETGHRLEACHKCNARWGDCCNSAHLYWGTADQNRYDRYGRKLPDRQEDSVEAVAEALDTSPP